MHTCRTGDTGGERPSLGRQIRVEKPDSDEWAYAWLWPQSLAHRDFRNRAGRPGRVARGQAVPSGGQARTKPRLTQHWPGTRGVAKLISQGQRADRRDSGRRHYRGGPAGGTSVRQLLGRPRAVTRRSPGTSGRRTFLGAAATTSSLCQLQTARLRSRDSQFHQLYAQDVRNHRTRGCCVMANGFRARGRSTPHTPHLPGKKDGASGAVIGGPGSLQH